MFARLRKLQFFKAVESCTGGYGRFRCQRVKLHCVLMKDLILESANSMLPQEHQILMALNRITNKKIKTHVLVMFNVLT